MNRRERDHCATIRNPSRITGVPPVPMAWSALSIAVLTILLVTSPLQAQVPTPVNVKPNTKPSILRDVGIDPHLGGAIPADLVFRDEAGRPVKLGSYFGKRPIILTLVYYQCPMLCTMVLNDLTRTMTSLPQNCGEQFEVLTISFDPRETPELAAKKKEQYLRAYRRPGAEQGWHFLTGSQDSITRLTQAAGFRYVWDGPHNVWAHASGIVILTPEGKIARYFFGIDYAPTDLRLALLEAGEKKISPSTGDRILSYCFHYDPTTGKYGLMVMRLIQTGGVITLVLLGGSIWLTVLRDRRKAAAARAAPPGGAA
ncbi:MAG TPA: SCO family protein [Tepidisphaeraceae bacterium]|nr:SCO family protein [Tepidisphaeraceae bacterium]